MPKYAPEVYTSKHYKYLGHFRSPQNMARGHNDVKEIVSKVKNFIFGAPEPPRTPASDTETESLQRKAHDPRIIEKLANE